MKRGWILAAGVALALSAALLGLLITSPTSAHTDSSTTLTIDNGYSGTASLSVTLKLAWGGSGGDPTQARIANDLSPSDSCTSLNGGSYGSWQTITEIGTSNTATFPWTLASGSAGIRQVCIQSAHGSLGSPSGSLTDSDKIAYVIPATNPPRPTSCGVDISLVLDRSGSYTSNDLQMEKDAANNFVDSILGVDATARFRVVSFSTSATTELTLTSTATTIHSKISGIAAPSGSTNWEDALLKGALEGPDWIIFMTDGNPTVSNAGNNGSGSTDPGDVLDGVSAANAAKNAGISITLVGIDTQGSMPAGFDAEAQFYSSLITSDVQTGSISNLQTILDAIAASCHPPTDVKITAQTVTAPPTANTGSAFTITVNKTLHNNGPASPVTVSITPTVSGPADCTITPDAQNPTSASLLVSTAVQKTETYSVTCTQPSAHTFTIDNCIAITQNGVTDTNLSNNCAAQAQKTVNVLGTADVKVQSVTVSAPASQARNTPFNVTVTATLHNNGAVTPVNVDATLDLALPPDCTKSPTGSQTQQDASLPQSSQVQVQKTWSVTCSDPSVHTFNGSASVVVDQLHVSDSNSGNNSGQGQGSTNITGTADVKVQAVSVSAPATSPRNTNFNVTVTATLHNNGSVTPVSVDATLDLSVPIDCNKVPGGSQTQQNASLPMSTPVHVQQTWTVSCSDPSSHTFTGTASATIDQLHVSDSNSGNNSGQGQGSTNITGTADVKVQSVSVSAPAASPRNTNFNVTVTATLHNNGPVNPVNADTTLDLTVPTDCTRTPGGSQTQQDTSLPSSTAVPVQKTWTVTCTDPSNHTFTGSASTAVDQLHVSESNSGNNSGQGQTATAITGEADIKVQSVVTTAPGTAVVNVSFNVSVDAVLHNNGPVTPANVDSTLDLIMPAGCTRVPNNAQGQQDTSLGVSTLTNVSKTWVVNCNQTGVKCFDGSATASLDQQHVSDPNGTNNSGQNQGCTDIAPVPPNEADPKVTAVTVDAPPSGNAGTPFNVTVTATIHNNGPTTPVNVDTTIDLGIPADCTKSPLGSQTQQDTSLAFSVAVQIQKSWSITCSGPSDHTFNGSATVALDQVNTVDTNLNNNSGQGSDSTGVNSTADVKVQSVTVNAPATQPRNTPFNVTVTATLHNNGPVSPVTADATLDLSVPADCTRAPNSSQSDLNVNLPQSAQTQVQKIWSVSCSGTSDHTFTGDACAPLDTILHVSDPNTGNNCGQGQDTTGITGEADIKVQGVSVSAPASSPRNTDFNVTVTATLHNNGPVTPVNADASVDLSVPADCTKAPPGAQVQQDTSLAFSVAAQVQKSWTVNCSGTSDHTFTGSASASVDQLHVSDPNTGNNSGQGQATTGITGTADVKVQSVSVSAPASEPRTTPFNVTVTATLHNNGLVTPVNADAIVDLSLPADCTKNPPGAQPELNTSLPMSTQVQVQKTWSVTCSDPSAHTFTGSASVAIDQAHVTDPNSANNSGQGQASTNITGTADVKVQSVSVSAPASAGTGASFNVTVTATLHNNGPVSPATADAILDMGVPGDCTRTPNSSQAAPGQSLPQSTPVQVQKTWSVSCSTPSAHAFNGSASATLNQLHVTDPDGGNNSGQGQGSTNITGTADVKVQSVTVDAPTTANRNTDFTVNVTAVLHNNGPVTPVNADATVGLTGPGDCTLTPASSQGQQDVSLPMSTPVQVQKSWTANCQNPSNHQFTANVSVSVDQNHVSDPNSGNNTGSGNDTTGILGTADVKLVSVSVNAPATAGVSSPFQVNVQAVLHNNGPVDPVSVNVTFDLTVPADCTRLPNNSQSATQSLALSTQDSAQQTWTVTCSQSGIHNLQGTASVSVSQQHVTDPTSGNNSGQNSTPIDIMATPTPTPSPSPSPTPSPSPSPSPSPTITPPPPPPSPTPTEVVEGVGGVVGLLDTADYPASTPTAESSQTVPYAGLALAIGLAAVAIAGAYYAYRRTQR